MCVLRGNIDDEIARAGLLATKGLAKMQFALVTMRRMGRTIRRPVAADLYPLLRFFFWPFIHRRVSLIIATDCNACMIM